MKEKKLSFAFISFGESGLFNGLRAKKIKNSARVLTRVMGCAETPSPASPDPRSSAGLR
jgi:hypothetical protein